MVAACAGMTVLVTRPSERADGLVAALEATGVRAVRWPTLAIEPLADRAARERRASDIVIFASPAAVHHGRAVLQREGAAAVGAVGPATAAALREQGMTVAFEATGSHDSEGLLRQPILAPERVAGRHVLIVRGEGGREHLARTLVARGATVDYAAVYRRVRPAAGDPALAAASDIVTVTSSEGVTNLLAMLDPASGERLRQRPLVTASERIAARARQLGFSGPIEVATGADDAAMCAAVERVATRQR